MLAIVLFAVGALCAWSSGFAAGRGWRTWGDDAEIDPGAVTLALTLLTLGIAFFAIGAMQ